jgi:hypothetical protein
MKSIRNSLKKYNFGCGDNKIDGCINIDINEDFKPDLVLDFLTFPYPLEDSSASHIYFLHVIEHIQKIRHPYILLEFYRILSEDGRLIIAFPEFLKIAKHWVDNYLGKREFWEATIYGRQSTKFDYHVCAMYTPEFKQLLQEVGFDLVEVKPEVNQEFNTIIVAKKGTQGVSRELGVRKEIWGY